MLCHQVLTVNGRIFISIAELGLGLAYYGIVRVILKDGLMGRAPAIATCMTTKVPRRHVLQHKLILLCVSAKN